MTWIEGIGGAFIFSNDPARLAGWYTEHLGLCFEGSAGHGTFQQVFRGLDPEDRQRKPDTTFSIMQARVRDCDGNRIELNQPLPAVDQPSPPPDDGDR